MHECIYGADLSAENNVCLHPGAYGGLCFHCGQKLDVESGVAFGYIKQVTFFDKYRQQLCFL